VSAPGILKIATCQFPVSADIRRNSRFICRQMRIAARRRAEIVHFPEAALSGYAGADFPTFQDYPWDVLAEETRRVLDLAAELRIWTILGSSHQQPRGKPTNCLYLVDPSGRIAKRYDKCFLTPQDRRHYQPGHRVVTHTLGGVKFGLLICFDFRFPEIWRACLRRGCRLIFLSSYQSESARFPLMEEVAPAILATRASENFFYVAASNTTGGHPWHSSRVVLPQGDVARRAPAGRAAVVTYAIDLNAGRRFYNPIGSLALRAARGILHS
jgi:predicted amidohydrolase